LCSDIPLRSRIQNQINAVDWRRFSNVCKEAGRERQKTDIEFPEEDSRRKERRIQKSNKE
jgi:hypothetical protein